ncbi:MAG TPA: diaminopimelate decarboxylase, partial [Thermoanaerobaculia bacterium]|nr:diaminopimelate decarboxylase [Thermoanaerobaculia bacterium]
MNFTNGSLHIAGAPVARLIEEFGSPLYVYDRSAIERQIERVRTAFGALPLQPFYAAKANSNLTILRMIAAAGFGCDAVSPGEVFLARKAGFPARRIWFTC